MFKIREFNSKDIKKVKKFLDKYSGENYLNESQLSNIVQYKSQTEHGSASFVVVDSNEEILGIRITYVPKKWIDNKTKGITPQKWNCSIEEVAKFHCLFLSEKIQGQGIGPKLSEKSINVLKKINCKGIICHSWLESPNNSSQKYLKKFGFESVNIHKKFWNTLDYHCTGCNKKTCICSAEEMIYYIK